MYNSLALTDGYITIYELSNTAEQGNMPAYKLTEQFKSYYGERTLSYSRQYQAKGANEQIDRVVRIINQSYRPYIGQYATIENFSYAEVNGDGALLQYRIDNVQQLYDDDGQSVFDITLSRLENFYEIDG